MEYNIEAEATVLAEFEAWWLGISRDKILQLTDAALNVGFIKDIMFLGYRQGYAKGWLSLLAQVREKYGLLND